MKVLASDLHLPEGPVVLPDGSLAVVEIAAGRIRRIWNGSGGARSEVIATTGGGPNGLALGPDGALYVCNNGGYLWRQNGAHFETAGVPGDARGRIERVDLATGKVEVLYDSPATGRQLHGPNDLVFDAHGGFWFTDNGKADKYLMRRGGLHYARADGSEIREVVHPMLTPNGVGLSPDGRTLYVVETQTARLWAWDIAAPGELARDPRLQPYGGRMLWASPQYVRYDSLGVEAGGNICLATMVQGGICVCSPKGGLVEFFGIPQDSFITNICFGGPDMKKAYITCSGLGQLIEVDWPRPGLRLNYG